MNSAVCLIRRDCPSGKKTPILKTDSGRNGSRSQPRLSRKPRALRRNARLPRNAARMNPVEPRNAPSFGFACSAPRVRGVFCWVCAAVFAGEFRPLPNCGSLPPSRSFRRLDAGPTGDRSVGFARESRQISRFSSPDFVPVPTHLNFTHVLPVARQGLFLRRDRCAVASASSFSLHCQADGAVVFKPAS